MTGTAAEARELVQKAYYAPSPHSNRGMTHDEIVERISSAIAAALTAARAEGRRAGIEECARWHDKQAKTTLAGSAHERSAAHHRSLADAPPGEGGTDG